MADNLNVKSMLGNQQNYRIFVKISGQLHCSGEEGTRAQLSQKDKQSLMLEEETILCNIKNKGV